MLSHCAPISIHSTIKYLSSCVRNLSCIILPSTGNTFSLGANWLNFSSYNLQINKLLMADDGLAYLPPRFVSLPLCTYRKFFDELLNSFFFLKLTGPPRPLMPPGLLALWQ